MSETNRATKTDEVLSPALVGAELMHQPAIDPVIVAAAVDPLVENKKIQELFIVTNLASVDTADPLGSASSAGYISSVDGRGKGEGGGVSLNNTITSTLSYSEISEPSDVDTSPSCYLHLLDQELRQSQAKSNPRTDQSLMRL
jgi:hypothetical protein